jgi:hypothetical protein
MSIIEIDKDDLDKLLNRINRVTCYFRHNNDNPSKIPKEVLIELTNYQIEFEKKYKYL